MDTAGQVSRVVCTILTWAPNAAFRQIRPWGAYPRRGSIRVSTQRPSLDELSPIRDTEPTPDMFFSAFLEFSASRGNDLATPHPPFFPGLTEGCRWCLCVSRWKEALLAYRAGDIRRDAVPRYVVFITGYPVHGVR